MPRGNGRESWIHPENRMWKTNDVERSQKRLAIMVVSGGESECGCNGFYPWGALGFYLLKVRSVR